MYHQFQTNDQDTAWRYAFDAERFRRLRIAADFAVPYRVEYDPAAPSMGAGHDINLMLDFARPCQVRLDRLLAEALGLSRTLVQQWLKRGRLKLEPDAPQAWRKPARHGQCIIIPPIGTA